MIEHSALSESQINHAYPDGNAITIRKNFYRYACPDYVLEKEIIQLLHLSTNDCVVDIGCGTGKLLQAILASSPDISCIGVDISSGIIANTKTSNSQKQTVHFLQGDIQRLPFEDNTANKITALHMMYHVENVDSALSEVKRVLCPTGLCIISADSIESKPKLRAMKQQVANIIGTPIIPDTSKIFNIEEGEDVLKQYFPKVTSYIYPSIILLTDSQPYIEYFDATRMFWEPYPNDEVWREATSYVRSCVQHQIDQAGSYTEQNIYGCFVVSY